MAALVQAEPATTTVAQPVLAWRRLVGRGSIVVIGSAVSNVLSFGFAFVTARLLKPADYATVTACLSLLVVAAVPTVTLQLIAARYASIWSHEAPGRVQALVRWLNRVAILVGAALALGVGAWSGSLAHYLQLSSSAPLMLVAAILFCTFLSPVYRGVLQGHQHFGRFAVATTSEYLVRFVVCVGLLVAGLREGGALGAVLVGAAVSALIGWRLARPRDAARAVAFPLGEVLRWSAPTFLVQAALNVLLFQDTLLAKHFFGAAEAGAYAGLATTARIIVYLSGALSIFLFPIVARSHVTHGQGRLIAHITLGILTVVELVMLALYAVAPATVLRLVVGSQYVATSPYLPQLGVAIAAYALISMLATYLLAVGDRRFWLPLLAAPVAQTLALATYHGSLAAYIGALDVVMLATLGMLLVSYFMPSPRPINLGRLTR